MTHSGAHVEEATLEAGGDREDVEIFRGMIQMQVIVAVGPMANQTTLKEIVHGGTKVRGGSKLIMHLAVIKMIQEAICYAAYA